MTSTGLLASASTLRNITALINRYLYSNGEWVTVMVDNGKWWVKKAKENYFLPNHIVTKKNGRFRFSLEMGIDPNKEEEKAYQLEMFQEQEQTTQLAMF